MSLAPQSPAHPGAGRAGRPWIPAFARMNGWGGAFAAILLAASPAFASPVELRGDVAVHDGRVTLGDLFDEAGSASGVVVASGGQAGGNLVLDAGRVQALAAAHGLQWSNEQGMQRVIARADDATRSAPSGGGGGVRARPAEALTYGRDFRAGEIIRAEDLVWSRSPEFGVPLDTPHDPRSVIGQAARRPLRAGAAVSMNDLSTPEVIKKDDVVQVAFEAEGIKLILQGKALSGAALGDTVDIQNPASRKTIQAIATGSDEAVVGPEADRLRAGAPNSKLFASIR